MNHKTEFLQSIQTRQLQSWRDQANAGGGVYTAYDSRNNRTMVFKLDELVNELASREPRPSKPPHQKGKGAATKEFRPKTKFSRVGNGNV